MAELVTEHRTRRSRLGNYYWSSVRRGSGVVRGVPRAWPAPVRVFVQAFLTVAVVAFVLLSWTVKTVVPVLRVVGGRASEGRSPSGPPKYYSGNG